MKEEALLCPDEPSVLEYRVIERQPRNFPASFANSPETPVTPDPPVVLWRFELPRAEGRLRSARGSMTVGAGRANCDGTYSFYGEHAAPEVAEVSADAARWAPLTLRTSVEVDDQERARIAVHARDEPLRRALVYRPNPVETENERGFEIVRSGYSILDLAIGAEQRDCLGAREGWTWVAGGTIESYLPLAENDRERISLIGQSYCQLMAFNILPMAYKDVPCLALPRCLPNSEDCRWKKLPDSLCPTNDEERARFGCHLGAEGNVNLEEGYPQSLRCGSEGITGEDGPCCDPLGQSSSLPACNAYRVLQDYAAYAVEISDQPAAGLSDQRCTAR